jgi:hypothetical protein
MYAYYCSIFFAVILSSRTFSLLWKWW